MDADTESFVLLLLSDGNLPTGSFVASSGLEAYVKHGFFSLASPKTSDNSDAGEKPPPFLNPPSIAIAATINFLRDSVQSYSHTTLPFISSVYGVCDALKLASSSLDIVDQSFHKVRELDELYEATTLNHVARRASTSQGVALLTLLLRGLIRPTWLSAPQDLGAERLKRMEDIAEKFKLEIRRGNTPGHLPICWSILTSALNLSCGEPN